MKKQLKEELVALAEKLLLLKKQQELSASELKELTKKIYDKLTILEFVEENLFSSEEKEEKKAVKTAVKVTASEKAPENDTFEPDEHAPSGLEYNDAEAITEPNTEKIKDIVAQMPAETQQVDDLFAHVEPKSRQKSDMENLGGIHYDNLPTFEPVSDNGTQPNKPRSLNDRLKTGINIGVNDKLAFIKHLFDGSNTDYNRVLSQLNSIKSREEAFNFVANVVKPDYNNWEGKEDYEARFLAIIEKKFE